MMKSILHSERLILKLLDENDAELVHAYLRRNKEFLQPWEPERSEEFYRLDTQKRALATEAEQHRSGELHKLWIFRKEQPESVIGSVTLSNIVYGVFQSCHLGYRLDAEQVNRGYMTEAVRLMIDYAFNGLGLHRVEANIMPRNEASLQVVRKLGFYEEGKAIKYLKINGIWEDHVHMVIRNSAME